MNWTRVNWFSFLLVLVCGVGQGVARESVDAYEEEDRVDIYVGTINKTGDLDLRIDNSKNKNMQIRKTEDFHILQGDPETRRTVNTNASTLDKHLVADITIPAEEGDLFYEVNGLYVGGGGTGGGGETPTWDAEYNRGDVRVILEINTPSEEDDYVGLGFYWTKLHLTLANGTPGTTYTISDISKKSGSGGVTMGITGTTISTADYTMAIYVKGETMGGVTITATCDNGASVVDATGMVISPIKTPHGDPTTTAGANEGNEITFSAAATGVADVPCEANRIVDDPNKLRWEISDAGATKAKWTVHVTGDDETGKGLNPHAKYTGLPANNDDFGAKTITLTAPGINPGSSTQVMELFYQKTQKNHPGGHADWPNWMFYWLQTVTPLGPGPITWKYGGSSFFTPGTTQITLSDIAMGSYPAPYGTNNPLKGIDTFAYVVRHESQHYKDWLDFWNNNVTTWTNAEDKTGPNDDKDSDRIPNKIEDVDLSGTYNAGDLYDWKVLNTPTAGRPAAIDNDSDDWNCQRNKTVVGDHSKDWGDPGWQHKSLTNYND